MCTNVKRKLNDIPNVAVILNYPEEDFRNPKALRIFIIYQCRNDHTENPAVPANHSPLHVLYTFGKYCASEKGYLCFQNLVKTELLSNLHRLIKNVVSLENILRLSGSLYTFQYLLIYCLL